MELQALEMRLENLEQKMSEVHKLTSILPRLEERMIAQKDDLQDLCFDQMSDWIQQHMSHYLAHARVHGTMVYFYRA